MSTSTHAIEVHVHKTESALRRKTSLQVSSLALGVNYLFLGWLLPLRVCLEKRFLEHKFDVKVVLILLLLGWVWVRDSNCIYCHVMPSQAVLLKRSLYKDTSHLVFLLLLSPETRECLFQRLQITSSIFVKFHSTGTMGFWHQLKVGLWFSSEGRQRLDWKWVNHEPMLALSNSSFHKRITLSLLIVKAHLAVLVGFWTTTEVIDFTVLCILVLLVRLLAF